MISRYHRRPVSHKLEIRGLSRSRLDKHPLPEEADDHQSPRHDHSSETSAASGHSDCPTIVSVDSSRSWSGIRSSTGTGLSTERSSVFSWGYDEFDQAASRQVQQMFEEIDKELYEGRGAGAGILQGLQEECQQWATRFPHLRYWAQASATSTPFAGGGVYSACLSALTAFWLLTLVGVESLNVQGRRAALLQSSSARSDGLPGASSGSGSQHQQRVIEVEGLMEEYLAFDSRDPDDGCERDHSDSGDWRRCLPPVSPSRCRRQAVLDLLFDGVWQQLVGWMKELVQHRWECCTFGTPPGPPVNNNPAAEPCVWSAAGDKASGSLNPVQEDSQDPLLLSLEPATVAK
uniref:Family with sequence similarity 149 member B1 n=1 Tax=Tetraodon nigroviridis TaxID=99883 RepID=H3DHZ9_TETNG